MISLTNFRSRNRVCCLIFLSCCSILLMFQLQNRAEIFTKVSENDENFYGLPLIKETYLYRAYLDLRKPGKTILRILAIRDCRSNSDTQLFLDYHSTKSEKRKTTRRKLSIIPLNSDRCPWAWAPNCLLSPHYVQTEIPAQDESDASPSTLDIDSFQICSANDCHPIQPISVHQSKTPEHELLVCVLPVYLFSDVSLMAIFIETWLKLGATKFLIYYTSATKSAFELLTAYSKRGTVDLVPWPMLPDSQGHSDPDPNKHLYRFGHYLALNDCIFRCSNFAKFVAPVDFDEFIFPTSSSTNLVTFLNKKFTENPEYYSLQFQHQRVNYNSSLRHRPKARNLNLARLNADWLDDLWLSPNHQNGPSKYIFRPDQVDILNNHEVIKPRNRYLKIPLSEAGLFHIRSSFILKKNSTKSVKFSKISDFQTEITTNLKKMTEKYSNLNKSISDGREIGSHVAGCLSKWREFGCKMPHFMCEKLLVYFRSRWSLVNESFPDAKFDVILA